MLTSTAMDISLSCALVRGGAQPLLSTHAMPHAMQMR